MYEVKLDGGKYMLINDNGRMSCLRYGETWRESIHDNVMLALVHAYEDLAEENARFRKSLENISYVYEDTGELAYDQRGMYVIAKKTLEGTVK